MFLCNAFRSACVCVQFEILYASADFRPSFLVVVYFCACDISDDNINRNHKHSNKIDRLDDNGNTRGIRTAYGYIFRGFIVWRAFNPTDLSWNFYDIVRGIFDSNTEIKVINF